MKTARRKSIEHSRSMIVAKKGFSLIELMIVITLFTITTIAVTTSYISFQGREIVKNAALQLKSDLRQAQNSAQSGDKVTNDGSSAGCQSTSGTPVTISPTVLGGWYLFITNGGTTYEVKGVCLNGLTETPFGSKTSNFPTGVNVSAISCVPASGSPITFGAAEYLNVFFMPLTNSVSFFKDSSDFFNDTTGVLNGGCLTGNGETVITLHSSDGDYEIHISQAGGIYEKKL